MLRRITIATLSFALLAGGVVALSADGAAFAAGKGKGTHKGKKGKKGKAAESAETQADAETGFDD